MIMKKSLALILLFPSSLSAITYSPIYTKCLDQSAGEGEMLECIPPESKYQEKILDAAFKAIKKKHPNNPKIDISEKSWRSYKTITCETNGSLTDPLNKPNVVAKCNLDRTIQRIEELKDWN
jgi:uncharacterized protein YecT (DUF1311 family)